MANMANIDTPKYHTHDINFEAELKKAQEAQTPTPTQPSVREVAGLIERPDGNNVNMERESLLLAQTQLQFQIGVEVLRHHFQRLQTAISGGSTS